jgi:nitrogen fixation protein NifU and related proteins
MNKGLFEMQNSKHMGAGRRSRVIFSLVTEWVKGKTLEQAGAIKNAEIAQELSLPPVKIHCSILAEDAIKAAIEDYRKKHPDDTGH